MIDAPHAGNVGKLPQSPAQVDNDDDGQHASGWETDGEKKNGGVRHSANVQRKQFLWCNSSTWKLD